MKKMTATVDRGRAVCSQKMINQPMNPNARLLFLTFNVLVANPRILVYTVANPARGLLNREKRRKKKA